MSYHDIDSPDYVCFSAGGDGRTTPEEREIERLTMRLEAAEKQRMEAVRAMQSIQPGLLSANEHERLERLKRRAYHLQNRIDRDPRRDLSHDKAELSALCWAVSKISGKAWSSSPDDISSEGRK